MDQFSRIEESTIYFMELYLHAQRKWGLGLKDLFAWNKATIAKLVWAIAKKKDVLWVKWVHARYLKAKLVRLFSLL